MIASVRYLTITTCLAAFLLFLYTNSSWRNFPSLVPVAENNLEPQSCAAALDDQVDFLISFYSKALEGVTHVALIGYPDHPNKGDSAIYVGEAILLEALQIEPVYICVDFGDYNAASMREKLEQYGPENTAVLFHGGGNFGDIWGHHQELRNQVVKDFLDYKIRSFPQTIWFNDPAKLAEVQEIYGTHKDLQLVVRDTQSYEITMRDFGTNHEVHLTPDMATMIFSVAPRYVETETKYDVLVQARVDGEGGQDHRKEKATFDELLALPDISGTDREATYKIDDWLATDPEGLKEANWNERAWLRVDAAYKFLTQGSFIITDRLHAHILSTVWELPHVFVEEGYYGKIRNYHETWLRACDDRVRKTGSVEEAVRETKNWFVNGRTFV